MAKIRGKNEGSIHQRKNGTWRAQVSLEGQRLSFTAKSKRECQEWVKKTVLQIDHGLTYASTTVSLDDHLENWLAITKASRQHSTWLHYEHLVRKYVHPHLGVLKLKDLRPDQVQSLYNNLLSDNVGVPTINKIHIMLHSALGYALKAGLINRNVTDAVIPPKAPAKEMKILDESQVSQMLIAARSSRSEALLHLAVATGMRQMELLGLKWVDLDWVKQTLKVKRQLVRSKPGSVEFVPPKTKHGRRTVALGSHTIEVLRQQYENSWQNEKQLEIVGANTD